jgi:hypothetical protein
MAPEGRLTLALSRVKLKFIMFLFITYCLDRTPGFIEKKHHSEFFYQIIPIDDVNKGLIKYEKLNEWYQPGPTIKDPEGLFWVKKEIVGAP